MKLTNFSLIVISLVFYGVNKFNRFLNYSIFYNEIINNYLNDVLAGVVIVSFSNILLEKKNRMLTSLFSIEIFTFCCGMFWEFIAPIYTMNSTSDFMDLFAYCLGGIIYWLVAHVTNR